MTVIAVIPAFNEESTLRAVASRCLEFCPVLIVDDASTDGTTASVADLPVTVLRNAVNRGKGGSLIRGFRAALDRGADAVITLDADGQHDPAEMPRLAAFARAHPKRMVIAARLRGRNNVPRARRFANGTADFCVSWAAGHRIPDTQSGFRLYPGELLQRLNLPVERSHGFVFESEVLTDAARLGFPSAAIDAEAIYLRAARASHYRAGRDSLRIARMLAGRLLRRGLYPWGLYRSLRG